ncbi:MAG: hypothetical protein ACOX8R_06605 [Bacillota bacterium]
MKKHALAVLLGAVLLLCGCETAAEEDAIRSVTDENGLPYAEDDVSYDRAAIERSDAAFLLDPRVDVGTDRFAGAMRAFFSAPATLYCTDEAERTKKDAVCDRAKEGLLRIDGYRHEYDVSEERVMFGTYRIRDPRIMAAFGGLFRDETPKEIAADERRAEENKGYSFIGYLGEVSIAFGGGKTYVTFFRCPEALEPAEEARSGFAAGCFVLERDLRPEIETAFESVRENGETVTPEEYRGNFE